MPLRRIGVNDSFGESGTMEELWQKYGLDVASIAQSAREMLQ
jgi:transketolase